MIVDSPSVGIVIQPSVYALQVRQKIGRYLRRVGTKTTICIADGGGFTVCQGRRGAGIIQRYIVRHGYRVVLSKKHLVGFLLLTVQNVRADGVADEHPKSKPRVLERVLCKVQLRQRLCREGGGILPGRIVLADIVFDIVIFRFCH